MPKNNRIVVDLSKVQWSHFYYRNQHGQVTQLLPKSKTVYGAELVVGELAFYHPDYPFETTSMRALRLGIVDNWIPELKLKLTASEYLIYTGDKAVAIHKEWSARIFGKKKS